MVEAEKNWTQDDYDRAAFTKMFNDEASPWNLVAELFDPVGFRRRHIEKWARYAETLTDSRWQVAFNRQLKHERWALEREQKNRSKRERERSFSQSGIRPE